MYHVYVLYSIEHRKAIVGYSNDLASLLSISHSTSTKEHTLPRRSCVLLHVERYESKKGADNRAKELKSVQGREFIRRLIRRKFGT